MRTKPLIVMLSGAAILCLTVGMSRSYGLFLKPITADLGISRTAFALAIAVQNLIWGLAQPVAGMISDRFGAARVLVGGAALYLVGLLLMSGATGGLSLMVSAGLLVGLGISATSFSVVLGAVGRLVAPERRAQALAVVSTGASFGQFMFLPVGQATIAAGGWSGALVILGLAMATILPLSLALKGRASDALGPGAGFPSRAMGEAIGHQGYLLLAAGFFSCGFFVAFIATHLPAYLVDEGLSARMGGTAVTTIMFFNVIGTYLWGTWAGRYRRKYLLACLYLLRAVAMALFLVLPRSEASILVFSAVTGLLWLGTVPLTSGLIAQMLGTRYLSTLFGGVFLSHQVGAFLGVWLGGFVFDATRSYGLVWGLAIALSLAATVIHLRILDETEPPGTPVLAAAADSPGRGE
jgi:predicted MFS family arabinose efflux permease